MVHLEGSLISVGPPALVRLLVEPRRSGVPGESAVGVFAGGDLNEVLLERFAVHVLE